MSDVNLSISKEIIQPIIDAKVSAAVCEALSGSKNIISDVVSKILTMKVDSSGKASSYSSDIPFIQWLCNNAIHEAAKTAVKEYIGKSKEGLAIEIQKTLVKNQKIIALNLVNSFIENTQSDYRMNVNIEVKKTEY